MNAPEPTKQPTIQQLHAMLEKFASFEIPLETSLDTPDAKIAFAERVITKQAYREGFLETFNRIVNGFNETMQCSVLLKFIRRLDLLLRDFIMSVEDLPSPNNALDTDDGVCAFTKNLSPQLLRQAYDKGLSLTTLGHGFGPLIWVSPPLRHLLSGADLSNTLSLEIIQGSNFEADNTSDVFDIIGHCQGSASQITMCTSQPLTPQLKAQFASLEALKALRHFSIKDEQGKIAACGFGVLCADILVLEGAYAINARALAFGLKHFARMLQDEGIVTLEWRNPDPRVFAHASRIGSWQAISREAFLKRLKQGYKVQKLQDTRQEPMLAIAKAA